MQCLNAELKKKINKDTQTLPFDWMLSNPKFVIEILKLNRRGRNCEQSFFIL